MHARSHTHARTTFTPTGCHAAVQTRGKLGDLCALLDTAPEDAAAMVRDEPPLITQDPRCVHAVRLRRSPPCRAVSSRLCAPQCT